MSNSHKIGTNNSSGVYCNLKPEDFIRGATPADINEKCLKLCCSYIGGSWKNASVDDDIVVTRITGGISNQVYRVQLKNTVPRSKNNIYPDEPTDVIIKLYKEKRLLSHHKDDHERLNDNIILTVMSQVGLGPKVFGIFNDGFIQAYHKHCKVGPKLMRDPEIVRSVAHVLAKVHHLSVPIRKEPYWNVKQTGDMIASAFTHLPVNQVISEQNLETLAKFDIREEFKWLKNQVDTLNCPLVFCHNDYLGNNILVTEPNNAITLIDLEYSSYGSRGYDLAVFLSQWGLEPNDYENLDMPEDEVMIRFIKLYIEGAELLEPGYSSKQENSVQTILYETKLMMAVFFLFWVAFNLHQREAIIEAIPFDMKINYGLAENYYKKYQQFKLRMQ